MRVSVTMESFYTLSSEGSSTDETRQSTPSLGTHDTSRASYHISDLASFAQDLQNAADRAFPNRGRSRYETVNVCLIRWADDELQVKDELDRLHDVFANLYGFNSEIWLIPSSASQIQLTSMACTFLQKFDAQGNLFIVYYGGHGTINRSRQNQWWCRAHPDSPLVDWSAVQTLFATAASDVLVLLDCCAAASSAHSSGSGVMEAIAACGFETRAPPPGAYSFTHTLIEVLEDWVNKPPFSAAMLHTEVLFVLKQKRPERGRDGRRLEWCSTPIHLVYTGNPKQPGIEICSSKGFRASGRTAIQAEDSNTRSTTYVDAMDLDNEITGTPLKACGSNGNYQVPHVLISIALEEDQASLDAISCRRWLADFPALAKYATVEGVYRGYSTLIVLSLPVMIWDLLRDDLACSFIGYVLSPNKHSLITAADIRSFLLAAQVEDMQNLSLRPCHSGRQLRRPSMSGDSSYGSGSESPDYHQLLAIAAKRACIAKGKSVTKENPEGLTGYDWPLETEVEFEFAINDDEDSSEWEDLIPASGSPKADEKAVFQRVDSKQELAKCSSLLIAMQNGSAPAGPVRIGRSKLQSGKHTYRSMDQKGLLPRQTRKQILGGELSSSTRQHLS